MDKTLSDKILLNKEKDMWKNILLVPDVKEFIKKIEEIEVKGLDKTCKKLMLKEIYKLAGKELSDG